MGPIRCGPHARQHRRHDWSVATTGRSAAVLPMLLCLLVSGGSTGCANTSISNPFPGLSRFRYKSEKPAEEEVAATEPSFFEVPRRLAATRSGGAAENRPVTPSDVDAEKSEISQASADRSATGAEAADHSVGSPTGEPVSSPNPTAAAGAPVQKLPEIEPAQPPTGLGMADPWSRPRPAAGESPRSDATQMQPSFPVHDRLPNDPAMPVVKPASAGRQSGHSVTINAAAFEQEFATSRAGTTAVAWNPLPAGLSAQAAAQNVPGQIRADESAGVAIPSQVAARTSPGDTSSSAGPARIVLPPADGSTAAATSGPAALQDTTNMAPDYSTAMVVPNGGGQERPPSATPSIYDSPWALDLDRMISMAEADLAQLSPGSSDAERQEFIRQHVHLRMLYLVAGKHERALQAVPGLEPANQEFWQQLFWAMANYFDSRGMPDSADRAAQTIAQLRSASQRLQAKARLELRNVTFCHKISSFGSYERFQRDEFSPGQPVLVYAEVDNFKSESTADGQFRTVLKSTIEIYRAGAGGELVHREEFPATEDLCRNHRRDYFHSYEITMPQRIGLGPHVLKLTVADQLNQKVASYSLNFLVK